MRIFKIFTACSLTLILLFACGQSSNNTGKDRSYTNYREAVKSGDFEAAHDSLSEYYDRYISELSNTSYCDRDERKLAENLYYNAFDYIYKAEIQYLISELSGDDCRDKILFLLEEIPVIGDKFTEGLCDFYATQLNHDTTGKGIPLGAYIVWTQHYNRICNTVLSLAINRKYQDLARCILTCYVDNVEVTEGETGGIIIDGVKVDGNHGYIKYTTTDKDAAKKKYDDAVSSGAFN